MQYFIGSFTADFCLIKQQANKYCCMISIDRNNACFFDSAYYSPSLQCHFFCLPIFTYNKCNSCYATWNVCNSCTHKWIGILTMGKTMFFTEPFIKLCYLSNTFACLQDLTMMIKHMSITWKKKTACPTKNVKLILHILRLGSARQLKRFKYE